MEAADLTAVTTAIGTAVTNAGDIGQAVLIAVATLVVVGIGVALVKKL